MSQSNLPHAIVIMYNGSDIDDSVFADLSANIVDYMAHYHISIPEMTVVKYFDTNAIAKLEMSDVARPKAKSERKTKDDPVENALKYLSVRYKTFFGNRDTLALAFQLSKDIQNTDDIALLNSLKIVCEEETVYEPQLKRYGISRDALNTIQKWYCMSVHGNLYARLSENQTCYIQGAAQERNALYPQNKTQRRSPQGVFIVSYKHLVINF